MNPEGVLGAGGGTAQSPVHSPDEYLISTYYVLGPGES